MKPLKTTTLLATMTLAISGLLSPTPSVALEAPNSAAETNNPGFSIQNNLVKGKGALPTAVYRNPGDNLLVYENSMPSFPSGQQFAYIKNAYGVNRYMGFQVAGTRYIYAECVAPGHKRKIGSDIVSAWIVLSEVPGYGCTLGHKIDGYL